MAWQEYEKALADFVAARKALIDAHAGLFLAEDKYKSVEHIVKLLEKASVKRGVQACGVNKRLYVRIQWAKGNELPDYKKWVDIDAEGAITSEVGALTDQIKTKVMEAFIRELPPEMIALQWAMPWQIWADLTTKVQSQAAAAHFHNLKLMSKHNAKFAVQLREELDVLFVKSVTEE